MLQRTRGRRMRDMVQAAKMTGGKNLAVVCPDESSMEAVNGAIEEGIVREAWLYGDIGGLPESLLSHEKSYRVFSLDPNRPGFGESASRQAVAAVRPGECQISM